LRSTSLSVNSGTARFGLLLVWLIAMPAIAQGTLESCRKLSDPAARFACYESLPLTPPAGTPGSRASGTEPSETPQVGEATVASTVPTTFSGWGPNEKIALENGQVWQVVDGSSYATRPGKRTASVKRGVLGAYFLDIDGVALSPRVRRIK
jgi:hypothetical protein